MTTPKKRKLLMGAIAFAALLLLLFLFRYQVAILYANVVYKPRVTQQFDQTFKAIEPRLKELGFSFTGSPPPGFETVTLKCSVVRNGQVECHKTRHSDQMQVTQTFIDTWQQKSPPFAAFLNENGWRPLGGTSLETLYANNDPQKAMGEAILYSHDKTGCTLLIEYSPSLATTSASQKCSRDFRFPDLPEPRHEY